MNRRFEGSFRFVAVLESHKDLRWPHIHGFTNVWLEQEKWSNLWSACGGGQIVWVSRVKKKDTAAEYVSKELEVAKYVGKKISDRRTRKKGHRTLWRSKGLKAKFELDTSSEWCIIKERVYDDEGKMVDFFRKGGLKDGSKEERKGKDLEATRSPLSE